MDKPMQPFTPEKIGNGYLNSTTVKKRNLWIVTHWLPQYGIEPSTWIVAHSPADGAPLWKQKYGGSVSAGGLDEAHHAVVAQVRAGTLP